MSPNNSCSLRVPHSRICLESGGASDVGSLCVLQSGGSASRPAAGAGTASERTSVWWDEHIGAGDAWRETIERQLDEARTVVVIWSKRSVGPEGSFVREEASRAQRRGVYVPVLIDPVSPPLGFGENQATSLKAWHGDRSDPHYRAVLAAIQRICGIDPTPRSQYRHRDSS